MSSWRWFLLSFLGGGIAFWIPNTVIPALNLKEQGYAVTAVCPIVLILFYVAVLRLRKGDRSGPSTAIFAMFGTWVLALLFILLAQGVRRGEGPGFGWEIVLLVMLGGSIIALWLETVAMVICHVAFERTRWIVPPSLWAGLKPRHSMR
jgi:hypothetical protein